MPTMYESILAMQDDNPTALVYENRTISQRKLLKTVQRTITFLTEHGIKRGDVVTMALPNIPAMVYAFYALDAIGAIRNIVHPLTGYQNIVRSMERTGSKFAIILATEYPAHRDEALHSPFTFFLVNPMHDNGFVLRHAFFWKVRGIKEADNVFLFDKFRRLPRTTQCPIHSSAETAVYLHSGGTTGDPKVIELSDDAFNALSDKMLNVLDIPAKEAYRQGMLAVLPTFHGFGLGVGVHTPIRLGLRCVLMMKFDAKKILRYIDRGVVTLIIGIPLLYQKLMTHPDFAKTDFSHLTACYVGGDNVPTGLISAFGQEMKKRGCNVLMQEGYGLTETVTVCNVNTPKNYRLGSVGKPLTGITNRICDSEGNPLPCGEVGEIYVSGNTLMNGYLDDSRTTQKVMVEKDGNVWIKTGDAGYIDQDGFLFLKGRIKRVFKISGINVYPAELEKLVTDNDDVFDASLEFFATPKVHTVLYLIKDKQSKKSEEQIREMVYALIDENMLKYAKPQSVVFLDEFPKTAVGKIDHSAFQDVM
jgi:long-chain acyl-CoA synthetase